MEEDADLGLAPVHERVGASLRAGREAQGLAIADVAERTRIPTRHLQMIETGDLDGLPAPTYSVGFVRSYARLLGLDGQALALQFREELAYAKPRDTGMSYEPVDPARTPTRMFAWACFAVAVVLGIAYLYWRGTVADGDGARIAAQSAAIADTAPSVRPSAVPAPIAPPPVATTGVGTTALLTATSTVWLKVYEMGGATLFMGLLQPGEHYAVPAGAIDPRLLTSRPNALDVTVGGAAIATLGPAERRIKDVSLKPAALLAHPSQAAVAAAPAATPVENSAAPQ